MRDLVQEAFKATMGVIAAELPIMPLSRWNESVYRFLFSRELAKRDGSILQHLECSKIDLVCRSTTESAFIEFKFYIHNPRFDPYDGAARGYKGGPGPGNLREFRSCVSTLHDRPWTPGLHKFIVLAYADLPSDVRRSHRYATHYEDYQHDVPAVALSQISAAGPVHTPEGDLIGRLFEIQRDRDER